MPSKERQELIETVAQKMQAKWSGGLINWDRLHGQLKKDYRDIAEVAVDAIRADLLEDRYLHEIIERYFNMPHGIGYGKDRLSVFLAASALGEQSE